MMGPWTALNSGHCWEYTLCPADAMFWLPSHGPHSIVFSNMGANTSIRSWVTSVTPDFGGEVVLTPLPWHRLGVMIGPVVIVAAMHWGTAMYADGDEACSPGILRACVNASSARRLLVQSGSARGPSIP